MRKQIFWQMLVALMLIANPVFAQLWDLEILVSRNKLEEKKERALYETITEKQIAYDVKVRNKTFSDMENIEVKYMIFYEEVQPGNRGKPIDLFVKGGEAIKFLKSHSEATFLTSPVTLKKSELDGGVGWVSGASGRAKDSVTGVWFRAFSNGKQVGEYANPASVAKKNDWKQ